METTPFFNFDDLEEDEDFDYSYNSNFHRSLHEMMELYDEVTDCDTCEQFIDARNASIFYEDNIENARSLPWDEFVNDDATLKLNRELRSIIKDADLDYHYPATFFARPGAHATFDFAVF